MGYQRSRLTFSWFFLLQKSDSLGKLFEMDDNPERKPWLDRLLGFMEEKRTPITACPTISKQPLDLFRLYFLVKERSGYIEVRYSQFGQMNQVTNSLLVSGNQKQDVEGYCRPVRNWSE